MIISMTGFGRSELKSNDKEIYIEVRSLNNRYLDVSVRLPKNLYFYEDDVKNIVRKYLSRGRVTVVINIKEANGVKNLWHKLDLDSARSYYNLVKNLKKELHLSGKINLDHLLTFQDIFLQEVEDDNSSQVWTDLQKSLDQALQDLNTMRIKEGNELRKDLVKRIAALDKSVEAIENLAEKRITREFTRLKERIADIGKLDHVDEGRLELEIALLASRIDVTEECIRFKSHNKLFLEALTSEEVVGRKLNFILQEMTREANTISAKASDADISHLVVEIKEEVEKIREQVQNIE